MSAIMGGQQIPMARPPKLVDGLGRADRDLASEIRNVRRSELPWWSLKLVPTGSRTPPGLRSPTDVQEREPEGSLQPLLTSPAGEVVAAVWDSPTKDMRVYVLPAMESWTPILKWLAAKAVPEFVPAAARRARLNIAEDPALQTLDEAAVTGELAHLEREYEQQRAVLDGRLASARAAATAVRDPLLFGSSTYLAAAVGRVLTDAGLDVIDLDAYLGDTISADLLVTDDQGQRVLVEVKSASGMPGEDVVGKLLRHLQKWPLLRPNLPVEGGLLVVNHQARLPPADRSPRLFINAEFADSLTVATLNTVRLFDWWRQGDFATIRAAVFGNQEEGVSPTTTPPPQPQTEEPPKRRRFGRRP